MRSSGILMPIFSLPSKYGIGTFGKEAYRFVDFLKKSGQTYWQILPLGITGFGDSPYQSFSSFAGNPYFIDLDMLVHDGLLTTEEIERFNFGDDCTKVNYALLYTTRYKVLYIAYKNFTKSNEYKIFCTYNKAWLDDFALFMAIKDSLNGASFDVWPDKLKFRDKQALNEKAKELEDIVEFYKFQQYEFNKQWVALKKYANSNNVYIIGDIPIYTAYDSADVWANQKLFLLDKDLKPSEVAGCPPDAFSEDGQLWGNPVYNWEEHKKTGYAWWINRIDFVTKLYDTVRIDHFRGFSAYFSIPYGETTAKNGKWVKGVGYEIFEKIKEKLGEVNIIAENLGTLDEDCHALLKQTGFAGMAVLQFAFDPDDESKYLPHNIGKNTVVYTGTHDNDTAIGYLQSAPKKQVKFMREYLRIGENDSFNWSLIKAAMETRADICILQMQDFLGLDNSARINTPAVSVGNWCWRISGGCANDWLADIIYNTTKTYCRLPEKSK